jgi:hypothetical protein
MYVVVENAVNKEITPELFSDRNVDASSFEHLTGSVFPSLNRLNQITPRFT